jgi:predicted DNA binding CopG/RHH family protein
MTKDKRIAIRLSSIDYAKITALKERKKAKNEVFNLSKLIRNHLQEIN